MSTEDEAPMNLALRLAGRGLRLTQPNPRVGCVITDPSTQAVLGQGHTQQAGGPHAEVMALRDAAQRGHDVRDATVWVTLEPCSHHGRTPPCCDALVAAGVGKVVVATLDPNPLVRGRGVQRLRAAGIAVEILDADDARARAARDLNIGFFSRMIRHTPWVRMKVAASLDGVTALPDGRSQWITGEAARTDGHAWRARACAVLTGIGTVLADDPMLDVRAVPTPRQPHLVIVDSQLRTPPTARLWSAAAGGLARRILLYHALPADLATRRGAPLQAQGATLVACPGANGAVDLEAMLRDLADTQEVNELHVEAGHRLNGALLAAGLVDEMLLYLAPCLLGRGAGLTSLDPPADLAQRLSLYFQAVDPIGEDLRIVARLRGRDRFVEAPSPILGGAA
jgi:diaminohydroxyphosphoribosylaminopyrimidine deaminase/5-amino-6-(5-phosphoribosylamino)uracil reductase